MDPFGAGAALNRPALLGHISSAHCTGKDEARVKVAGHQEKEKNEKTRKGKRKAKEERRQAIYFKEAKRCPSALV